MLPMTSTEDKRTNAQSGLFGQHPQPDLPVASPSEPHTSTFGHITARALAEQVLAEGDERSDVDPLLDRAETLAEQLSGTPVGREMLAQILIGAVDKVMSAVEEYLATLAGYADGIEMITAEDGTEYRLITLESLTGWRRRQAWKLLLSMADTAKHRLLTGLDMAAIAAEIAGGEKGVELLGLAYGPAGKPYDKSKVAEYGAAVDNVLNTKQITGVILRFFSLSASSIATFSRNCLEGLVVQALGTLQTVLPVNSATGGGE
jgi:hypothetical protein